MIKICTKCGQSKCISDFSPSKQHKDKLHPYCKVCKNSYYIAKKDNDEFKKKRSERMKEYSKRPEVVQRSKHYYEANKYSERIIERRKILTRERKKCDTLYRLKVTINKIIDKAFKRRNLVKPIPNKNILGCEYDYFLQYIESQFESWMNWDNRGLYNGEFNYGWDIDHIMPLKTAKNEIDMIKINHYTNFKPLCSKVNRYIKK